jgi:thiamine-phosphate pyrophosphorylase
MIPKLHYITQGNSPAGHLENIQKACSSGIELVQLNLGYLPDKKLLKIAQEAREITAHFQTRLILNNNYKIAKEVKADGVHLDKTASSPTSIRKELFTWQSIGATANNLEDAEALIEQESDYIYLAPFRKYKNEEHKNTELGLNGFTLITEALNTQTPIIGFGNIILADVTAILGTGITGIAVAEAITQNFNSIREFNQLLNASSTQEQRHTFK